MREAFDEARGPTGNSTSRSESANAYDTQREPPALHIGSDEVEGPASARSRSVRSAPGATANSSRTRVDTELRSSQSLHARVFRGAATSA